MVDNEMGDGLNSISLPTICVCTILVCHITYSVFYKFWILKEQLLSRSHSIQISTSFQSNFPIEL